MSDSSVVVKSQKPLSMLQTTPEQWAMVKEQAKMLVSSGLLPKTVDTPEKAIAIMLKGRELGYETMQSFAHINVIEGKPVLDSHGMLGMVYKNCPGATVDFVEHTDQVCKIMAARPGKTLRPFIFTIDDAQRANLLFKDNWKKHPKSMLRSRAVTLMARALFADCIDGYISEDEAEEIVEHTQAPKLQEVKAQSLTDMLKGMSSESVAVIVEKDEEIPF